jgi:hypothetical protein
MEHYVEAGYNADDMEKIFNTASRIVSGWWTEDGTYIKRDWHQREQGKYGLHPVVRKAMRMCKPDDWQLLLLQWPHQSETDPTRLAYTRDERSGEANRQVITTIGKYLHAHFSRLPDHAIRDLVATQTSSTFKIVHTTAEMIYHLHKGPRSCMVWEGYDPDDHPYQTYDPALGWHMAVRIQDGQTLGRALCNTDADGNLYWVRSYKRNLDDPNGYSHTDEQLSAWLKGQGYIKYDGYPEGTKLKYIRDRGNDCGFLAPYIDGSNQNVRIHMDSDVSGYLVVDDEGEWECDNTDGNASDRGGTECEDCGDRCREGDMYWVGRYDDRHVCESCQESNYRYGYGRNGNQYYIHEDDAEWVEGWGEYVDNNYLDDNNIVRLRNNELCHQDDAIEVDDDWYHCNDERICYNDYNECYAMRDDLVELHDGTTCAEVDAWCCTHTGKWYGNDVDYVDVCGEKFHPDVAPEINGETAE